MTEFLSIVKSLNNDDSERWCKKLVETLSPSLPFEKINSFVDFASALYWITYNLSDGSQKWVAYGAGNMARRYLPEIKKELNIHEVWDKYTSEKFIDDIEIIKPDYNAKNINVIVFVDDLIVREKIIEEMSANNIKNVLYFRDYIAISSLINEQKIREKNVSEKTKSILKQIKNEYTVIGPKRTQVLYDVIPNKDEDIIIEKKEILVEEIKKNIVNELNNKLIFKDIPEAQIIHLLEPICESKSMTLFELEYKFELLLRQLSNDGIKTRERPIRMRGDHPYDIFAIYEATLIVLESLFDDKNILNVVCYLKEKAGTNLVLIALENEILLRNGQYEKALLLAREAMHIDSNSLFASEVFVKTAKICKQNGLKVEEPLPEYNLEDFFCWSGISFAWCGGGNENVPDFAPCFRPLQCAAYPEGEFWTGSEWKEFRRSLLDGSFRYCQKNECPNIVSGWLPRKDKCEDVPYRALLDGDVDCIPELTELHFSYDAHCNLCCPSCRVDFNTNSKDDNERYNKLYDTALKPLVKKVNHLCLSGCGEAILSPHSKRILQSLSKRDYPDLSVELRTNATMLNVKNWNGLGDGKECIKHVAVSIDAATKDTFEKLRFPAKWDTVIENLSFIQSLRQKNEIEMYEFHVVVQKDNIHQLLDIVKMAESFDADAVTFSRMINWRNMPREQYDINNPFWISSPVHEDLLDEIKKILAYRDELENRGNKMYINIHFQPDPNKRYDAIRYGNLKIR